MERGEETQLDRRTVGYSEQEAIENTSTYFLSQTKITGDCLDQGKNFVHFGIPIIDSGIFLQGGIEVYCPASIDPHIMILTWELMGKQVFASYSERTTRRGAASCLPYSL